MQFPTISGVVQAPFKALSLAEGDTVTVQEATDMFYGGALYGYVGGSVRSNMVVNKTLGAQAAERVKAGKILGVI